TFNTITQHTNEYAVAIKNALQASWEFTRAHANRFWQATSNQTNSFWQATSSQVNSFWQGINSSAVAAWNWVKNRNRDQNQTTVSSDGVASCAPLQTEATSTLYTQMTRPLNWLYQTASSHLPQRSSVETTEPALAEMPSATSRATLS
ncbi:MAG TPA: hypothetical protein PLD88_07070, partial [Candidatus Berkiella sp.]|nr:hypothetical protein [Candidatus Berkiella sp.]